MPNLLEVPGAKPGQGWCDAAALRAYPTGVHRALKYVRNFCLLHPNHPERPIVGALGVAIQKIGLSQEKLKARQDAILALRTSLKATEIAAAVKKLDGSQKSRLWREINEIQERIHLTEASANAILTVKDKVVPLTRLVASLRKFYFKNTPG
jgi:hypothetical protein